MMGTFEAWQRGVMKLAAISLLVVLTALGAAAMICLPVVGLTWIFGAHVSDDVYYALMAAAAIAAVPIMLDDAVPWDSDQKAE